MYNSACECACHHSFLLSFSPRDPNSTATLDAFHQCIEWCSNERFIEEDVTEAKLSLFAQVSNNGAYNNVHIIKSSTGIMCSLDLHLHAVYA